MTIVAGFPGRGVHGVGETMPYVVLGADSEEVGDAVTSSVRKIEIIETDNYKCLLAGAGNGDFIDLAIQQVRSEMQPPFTLESIREQIEDIVTHIHGERIDQYPAHQQDDLVFSLLGAIWVPGSTDVEMIRVRRALSLVISKPATIGAGSDLAHYIVSNFHFPTIYGYPATRLMVYLLRQVKKYVPDCGGDSQIVVLDGRGLVTELWPSTITQHELSISVIMEGGAKWLFYFADPMAYKYDLNAVDNAVDLATAQIKSDIRSRMGGLVDAQINAATSSAISESVSISETIVAEIVDEKKADD